MRNLLMVGLLALFTSGAAITTDQVVKAFAAAKLEVKTPKRMGPQDYGVAPYVGKGVRFLIPSLGADNGGRIFDVPNAAERRRLANTYIDLGKQSALFYSWVFVHKNIVVQINGDLPEAQALRYKEALLKLR
ncbi:hypothetical protein DAERI_060113 [Deinococcus aerius]|uniref:Uncharacterized protein n=1 Tax=Deinococcus aerius TaxID=200253 RepID=A0A2I9CVB1_9DEIO|nr:hypothetical protein [Deinococcus aerius]GBF05853.1 hypothetical protein DAERI_060113 [Deinococcus aerius]